MVLALTLRKADQYDGTQFSHLPGVAFLTCARLVTLPQDHSKYLGIPAAEDLWKEFCERLDRMLFPDVRPEAGQTMGMFAASW